MALEEQNKNNEINTLIQEAKNTIGESETDDFEIKPTQYAAEVKEKAPLLHEVLSSSQITATAKQYEDYDGEAIDAKTKFKKNAALSNWGVFLTAVFPVFILVVKALEAVFKNSFTLLFVVLGVITVFVGGWSTMRLFMISKGRYLEKWKSSRAEAETRRLQYFKTVTQAGKETKPGDDPAKKIRLSLLQLEFFRRYQFEVQQSFYRQRTRQNRRKWERNLSLESWAVFVSATAAGVAGFLGVLEATLASIAAVGVIGTSLARVASTKEQVDQNQSKAELYGNTARNLETLELKLDEVREAAARGNREPLDNFVSAVHEQLSLEHQQWLQDTEKISEAIGKLNETLAKQRSELEKPKKE